MNSQESEVRTELFRRKIQTKSIKNIMEELHLPETPSERYIFIMTSMEHMCTAVNCGHEPSASSCQTCLIKNLSESLSFYHNMNWQELLIRKFYSIKLREDEHIQEARNRRVQRRGIEG